jgi:hypothetical protein
MTGGAESKNRHDGIGDLSPRVSRRNRRAIDNTDYFYTIDTHFYGAYCR